MLTFKGASLPKTDKRNVKANIDPTVVDEALIIKAVRDLNFENKTVASDTVTVQQLRHLTLSFKNIWKIENLQGLEKLEKLQLDNNIIQEIQSLDHLVNLKWLDLSFNAISEISGLDKLVNLTDLSLFNNQITVLKGLDNCKLLNVFSIGNNKIPSFEIITSYFSKGMKFKHLQVLNVAGNPFTKDPDYKNHIINSLPNLRYLDYSFIDEQQRNQIRESDEKFRTDTMTQDEFIKQLEYQEEEDKKNLEAQRKTKSARMDLVEKLSEELIQDEELEKVKTMKGVEEEIIKFQEKIKETVENLEKNVISKNLTKLTAIDKFEQAMRNREAMCERETIKTLGKFEHSKKLGFRAKDEQSSGWRQGLEDLYKETYQLKDNLLQIEHSITVDMEGAINDFDANKLQDIAKLMQEYVSGEHGFKKVLEAIKEFGQKLSDIAKTELDRFSLASTNNADISEWDEELQGLFENKETLLGTISNIKENLSSKANNKDQTIISLIDRDVKDLVKGYRERQYERGRRNVQQVHTQIEEYRKLINEMLANASSDESDG